MPKHENIRDFALEDNRTMLDDLYVVSESKVFLSCDSGIWPIIGGMKKNMVLSNMVSASYKSAITDWLPKESTEVLFKSHDEEGLWVDNSFEQLKTAVERFL